MSEETSLLIASVQLTAGESGIEVSTAVPKNIYHHLTIRLHAIHR